MYEIDESLASRVLEFVDQGLVKGLGKQIPGKMCVEAAVCAAMGLPHSDNPPCVESSLRSLKLGLNDSNWSNNLIRAQGMRRIAIAQLGTKNTLDEKLFVKKLSLLVISKQVPIALRISASIHPEEKHKISLEQAAVLCETEKSESAARSAAESAWSAARSAWSAARSAARSAWSAARSAAESAESAESARSVESAESAAWSAARSAESAAWSDKILSAFAEDVVQILVDMNSPGSKFLYLTQ